jgi:hypothetical protein
MPIDSEQPDTLLPDRKMKGSPNWIKLNSSSNYLAKFDLKIFKMIFHGKVSVNSFL